MKQVSTDNIKVFVRVRPLNEKQKQSEPCVTVNDKTIQMKDGGPDHRFSFDRIFEEQSTQEEIYQAVGHQVVEAAFEGFNGTVFAYGQTSSGKTHTCIGPDYMDREKRGILPRMIGHIYDKIKQEPAYIEFRIKISMVQIYMQKIKDLLDPNKSDLKIREKAGKGIYIQDVTEEYVASQEETISFVKRGIANRSVGQTMMNYSSSRSHMAFIITLYQNNLKDASAKSGKIILVDLAGSQKISKTGAEGKLLDEAKQINKSLLSLGNVINSLTENKISHIPYRDSKLTRLLQESLGGNAKTNLIINVSPSDLNEQQTLSSLRFGSRAKQIKNKPKVNREYTVAQLLLLLEKAEKRIQELELAISEMSVKRMKSMKKGSQVYVENLLDSDHPILETDQEDKGEQKGKGKTKQKEKEKSITKQGSGSKIKLHFESECVDSSEQQDKQPQTLPKPQPSQPQSQLQTPESPLKKLQEQKQILSEQIQMLNIEKVELTRELDILQQKYEITVKENKFSQSKINYLNKENQKLLEKLVGETCLLQEGNTRLQEAQERIAMYEEFMINLASMQQKQNSNPVSKIFGTKPPEQSLTSHQIKKIPTLLRQNKPSSQLTLLNLQQKIEQKLQTNQNKDIQIKQLQMANRKMEEELALFRHLEQIKEAFIQEKLRFGAERERLYKDLENRIQKVLQLEEKLDEEGERRKYYEQLIKSEQSQKNRKILLLTQHLNEVSQNFYVLKGQQSSWTKDTKRIESKLQQKNKRISTLQKQIMQLKQQIENLKLQVEELEINPKEESILDLDFSVNQGEDGDGDGEYRPRIVKVVRSSNFREPQGFVK